MAGLLSSWWSGKTSEESQSENKEERGGEEDGEGQKKDEPSWVSGLEGTVCHVLKSLTRQAGLVRNVTEYAATVGETVRNRVQESVSAYILHS